MAIVVQCACGKRLQVPADQAGQGVVCPVCRRRVLAGGTAGSPAPPVQGQTFNIPPPPPPRPTRDPRILRSGSSDDSSGRAGSIDSSFQELLDRIDRIPNLSAEIRENFRRTVTISDQYPEMALTGARKVLQYVIQDVFEFRVGEPAGTRPLENLIQRLVKDGHLPKKMEAYTETIRKLGNVGAHDFDVVTKSDVHQSLMQVLPIVEWYATQDRPKGVETKQDPSPQQPASASSAQPTSRARVEPQPGPSQTARRSGRPAAMPPLYVSSSSSSGLHPLVGVPPPAPTPSPDLWSLDTFGRNLTWWVIGATGGAAVGGNLGGLVGKLLIALGFIPWVDRRGRVIFP